MTPALTPTITHRSIVGRAWPIILANATVPLLGLADTAVLGNVGALHDLGAIALGSLIFSFVYWGFGFLRMGTTGFIAQAAGAGDEAEVRASLGRALLLAGFLGVLLICIHRPLATLAFGLLDGGELVEATAADYFYLRIYGAPATLATFALMGALIGLGKARQLLVIQLFLNTLNISLDIWFAGMLEMGAKGIALGTLIAEWSTLLIATAVLMQTLGERHRRSCRKERFIDLHRIGNVAKILTMLSANNNIMIRTLSLVFAFAWFTNQSALYGDVVLAANHILLQLVAFCAFFLDGYAYVTETLVGTAIGAKNHRSFTTAVRKTSELAGLTAALLCAGVWLGGPYAIAVLTDIPEVQVTANNLLYLTSLYVFLAVPAFQLDGIFIGATCTRHMRNAGLASLTVFLTAWWCLSGSYGVQGLWWAFIIYVCSRAIALLMYYPRLWPHNSVAVVE